MRVIAAPDSFKGSIRAADAARALAAGWRAAQPRDMVIELPLADGGEGTLDVLASAVPESRWHSAEVTGPLRATVRASWLEMGGKTHVVELAAAAGLTQLRQLQPLRAHSYGVGELIGHALDAGAQRVVIALGGSACTDGGSGALAALGARFLDQAGHDLPLGGGPLSMLARIDLSGLRQPPAGGVACLTDVQAPLLGPRGAAAVFGPQKGAAPDDVTRLDAGLARLAGLLGGDPAAAGAGAAGGTAYGLAAGWEAQLLPGAAQIAGIAGLSAALSDADLVITGEGRYDETSLTGKVVGAVLALAGQAGVRSAIVAGELAARPPAGTEAVDLTVLAGGRRAAIADPARWLATAAARLATAGSIFGG
jgi:glycerate 2-kinase